jgi:hypothetical protein
MPHPDAPTRRQLHAAGERSLLAAALFGAAALVASRGGYAGQVWPYVVMAVAVLPQALLALVARVDSEHRVDIRVSRRPIWPNAIVGIVLAGAALVAGVRGGAGSAEAWSAALRRWHAPDPGGQRPCSLGLAGGLTAELDTSGEVGVVGLGSVVVGTGAVGVGWLGEGLGLGEPLGDGVGDGVPVGLGDGGGRGGPGEVGVAPGRRWTGPGAGSTRCPAATTRTVNVTYRASVRPSQVAVVAESLTVYVPGFHHACQTIVEPRAAVAPCAQPPGRGVEPRVPSPQSWPRPTSRPFPSRQLISTPSC